MKKLLYQTLLLLFLTNNCCAQNNTGLLENLHFEDGICIINIVGEPTDIMMATGIDTTCIKGKQPTDMLAFVYNGTEYAFNINYDFSNQYYDSIIGDLLSSHNRAKITIQFYQFCNEPYTEGKIQPLGIIIDISPLAPIK